MVHSPLYYFRLVTYNMMKFTPDVDPRGNCSNSPRSRVAPSWKTWSIWIKDLTKSTFQSKANEHQWNMAILLMILPLSQSVHRIPNQQTLIFHLFTNTLGGVLKHVSFLPLLPTSKEQGAMTIISQHFLQILHISGKPLQPYQMIPGFPYGRGMFLSGCILKRSRAKSYPPMLWLVLCYPGDSGHFRGALYVSWLITWWTSHVLVACTRGNVRHFWYIQVGEIQNMILSTHLVDWKQSWWLVAFPSSIFDSNWWTSRLQHTQGAEEGLQGI